MNNHPLQFFKDIIESPYGIKMIENNFYRIPLTHEEEVEHAFSWPFEVNREEGFAIFQNPLDGPPTYKTYFKDKLESLCNNRKRGFINDLDTYLLKENEQKIANEYLQKILFEVNYLISVHKDNQYLGKYPIILETIHGIREHLLAKYGLVDKQIKGILHQNITPKLKWMGKVNVLTTLFYDLTFEDKKKGITPIIEATSKEIENFILNNFVDENGNPFAQNTINTNLKPSKQKEKRAKGEIAIEVLRS